MKLKKLTGFCLFLAMIFSAVNGVYGKNLRAANEDISAMAVSSTDVKYQVQGGYIFFDEGTGTITGFEGSVTDVVIPGEINGAAVTAIGEYAFDECYTLTGVEIPCSVISIGKGAFNLCSGLKSISIPIGVTDIGDYAFYRCSGLTGIEIPCSVTHIGTSAFYHCSGLTDIEIPTGVTTIGDFAFEGCSGLAGVRISQTVNSLGNCAFVGTALKEVTIPSSVKEIRYNTFANCKELTNVVIENGITEIGDRAFRNCTNLKSISIPSTVTLIAGGAFNGCTEGMEVWCERGSLADNGSVYPMSVNFKYIVPSIYGDADGSEVVTASDCAEVLQKVLSGSYKMPLEDKTADWLKYVNVDGDDILTANDGAYILQRVLDGSFAFPSEG